MGASVVDLVKYLYLWILEKIFLNNILTNPDEVYKLVKTVNKDTPSESYFLSVLQHMLLIRDDVYARYVVVSKM